MPSTATSTSGSPKETEPHAEGGYGLPKRFREIERRSDTLSGVFLFRSNSYFKSFRGTLRTDLSRPRPSPGWTWRQVSAMDLQTGHSPVLPTEMIP